MWARHREPGTVEDRNNLIAYLSTIGGIVAMCLSGAAVCLFANLGHDLPQVIAALGFIGSGVTGLVGLAGGFKGKGGVSETTAKQMLDKMPPETKTEGQGK